MDRVLEKDIETQEEIDLILERLGEVENNKVKSIDDAIELFLYEKV